LLALDPLRDPMGVLLALDCHALSVAQGGRGVEQKGLLRWIVDLVENREVIQIFYSAESSKSECGLRDLPNWSYSYALALFQLHRAIDFADNEEESSNESFELRDKADTAIQEAMGRFPSVIGALLQGLEVDTTGRSFQRDWITVLDFATERARHLAQAWYNTSSIDTVALSATMQTCDRVVRIFVQENSRLWADDAVLQWMYDNLKILQQKARSSGHTNLPPCPSSAILRYATADPADYDNKIQQLPPEANVLDPNALAYAMVIDPNRPRFLRHRAPRADDEPDELLFDDNWNPIVLPTNAVDPDWPMLEVFWRSFLPWNHVVGIPPPRR
jgi:Transcriptional repressor TCF25